MRTADVAPQPWPNGRGIARELLVRPAGPAWRVRVNVAEIDVDAPFSIFAGVVRWFAVLEGAGVELTVDGSELRCAAGGDAAVFDGAARTTCRLLGGPARALNLMLRDVRGALRRVVPGAAWQPGTRACGLYATAPATVRVDGGRAPEPIPANALCWWPDAPGSLAFDGAGWWLAADTGPTP